MRRFSFRSFTNRFKHGAIASLFVATQLIFVMVASGTTFATAAASIDQCLNGQFSAPVDCSLSNQWGHGNLNAQQSHYREGDSVPYRVAFSGLSTGPHSIAIDYETTNGGLHALDYLTTYNRTVTNADPCAGVSTCTTPSSTTWPVPNDTNVTSAGVTPVPGQLFTLFNGTITGTSGYTIVSGSYAGTSTTEITVDFNYVSSNPDPVLAWGGHIASQIDWGGGNSASSISGSPYHTSLGSFDGGSVGAQDVSLKASAILPTPSIKTVVATSNATVGSTISDTATLSGPVSPLTGTVAFYVCGPGANNSCLPSDNGNADGAPVTISPGTGMTGTATSPAYQITAPGNYCFGATYTPDSTAAYSPIDDTDFSNECFTATIPNSTIEIIKDANPTSGQPFTFDTTNLSGPTGSFTLTDSGTPGANVKTFSGLAPGVYTVTESPTSGWDFTNLDCGGASNVVFSGTPATTATITIGSSGGQSVVCTYTNTEKGTITVIKNVNDGFGNVTSDVTNWNWDVGGTGAYTTGSGNPKSFSAGNYIVSEEQKTDYHVSSSSCTGQTSSTLNTSQSVTVNPGENVVCTFTNTRDTGTLTVDKTIVPSTDSGKFNLMINGPTPYTATDQGNGGTTGTKIVVTGSYSASEAAFTGTNLSDYSSTYSCSNGSTVLLSGNGTSTPSFSVNHNDNITCTFTNTRLASLTIVKDALPFSGTAFNFTTSGNGLSSFSLTDDSAGTSANQKQFIDLAPGSYSVSEIATSGWDLTGLSCNTSNYSSDTSTGMVGVTLSAGENVVCTYTNTELGSISGYKYEANADSTTVGPVAGITIDLLVNGSLKATTFTGADGSYSFGNLLPNNYSLEELLPSGWTQIYGPSSVSLTPGQDSTSNNFGNFKNVSIGGYKFDDLNGNGIWDGGEPGLSGWTINLYNSSDVEIGTQTTATGGSYNFSNIGPGTYKLCEVLQTGWVQTYPGTSDGCQVVTVNLSGANFTSINFGNEGRGTITVIKTVDDGLGGSTPDPSGWNWNLDGSGNYVDGGTPVAVSAGTYTVTEALSSEQSADYHVTDSSCSNGTPASTTVAPGANVVCYFTNTRNTGTLTVDKTIVPSTDSGKFNLMINGPTPYTATDQGNGGTTGTKIVVTGSYTVSETAYTGTNLSDYSSTYSCSNGLSGNGTSTPSFSVNYNDNITCTFTNTRLASLTIVKDALPNSTQAFNFHFGTQDPISLITSGNSQYVVNDTSFSLEDNGAGTSTYPTSQTFNDLFPTTYYVSEDSQAGWLLTNIACSAGVTFTQVGSKIEVTVDAGANVTCTYTNTENGTISVIKTVDDLGTVTHDASGWNWNLNGSGNYADGGSAVAVASGNYTVAEALNSEQSADYHVTASSCSDGTNTTTTNPANTSQSVTVAPDANVVCSFTNTRDTGTLTVDKTIVPSTDSGKFNLSINGPTSSTTSDQGNGGTTGAQTVDTGSYTASETAFTGTNLSDYSSTYSCSNGVNGNGTSTPSFSVNFNDNITCTFTNTRNTGTITVDKTIIPSSDSGKFDLNVNGLTSSTTTDQGNGGTTGAQTVDTGTYNVSETAYTGTNLSDYSSTYDCSNSLSGHGTATPDFSVNTNDKITCTFTNTRLASLTIVKDALPNSTQAFNFHFGSQDPLSLITSGYSQYVVNDSTFSLEDSGSSPSTYSSSQTFNDLFPTTYYVSEDSQTGWLLSNISCGEGVSITQTGPQIVVSIAAGANVTCTYTNEKLATVTVTKYNDYNLNGTYDPSGNPAEPALSGWQMILSDGTNTVTQTTGDSGTTGVTTFNSVTPGFYSLGEVQQSGWYLSNINCTDTEGGLDGAYFFNIAPGANIQCFVGNYQNPEITITKSNNRPNPTTVGDTVTYTLTVNVPTDSGVVYNATVIDSPPANFKVNNATATAQLTRNGLTTDLTVTNPNYGSPGTWNLGTLMPGDTVTMSYQATILSIVSDGTYPDLAFVSGFSKPGTTDSQYVVLGNVTNLSDPANTPFVGTQVSVISPLPTGTYTAGKVLGASILVNTGTNILAAQYLLPILLTLGVIIISRQSARSGKGDK